MENDSPNLFDSEPLSVKLQVTAEEDADDALAETIVEPNGTDDTATGNEPEADAGDVPGDADDHEEYEYRTDESLDGDEEAVDDPSAVDADDWPSERPQDDRSPKTKTVHHKGLPPGRVKLIMKKDPDVNIIAGDAVFLLTKATESFVGLLAQHCHKAMVASNKKTLQKKHIDAVIEENIPFEFLEGALDW